MEEINRITDNDVIKLVQIVRAKVISNNGMYIMPFTVFLKLKLSVGGTQDTINYMLYRTPYKELNKDIILFLRICTVANEEPGIYVEPDFTEVYNTYLQYGLEDIRLYNIDTFLYSINCGFYGNDNLFIKDYVSNLGFRKSFIRNCFFNNYVPLFIFEGECNDFD